MSFQTKTGVHMAWKKNFLHRL